MKPQSRSGHTLVEVIIAVTLMAIFLGAVGLISMRTSDAFQEGSRAAALDTGLHRAVELIARELEDAGSDQIDPLPTAPLGTSSLDFKAVDSYVDGIVWGPARRIAWEREPGELDDGLDNDGDSLIDEGRVVWCELPDQPDERRRVLVGGVMELDSGESANGADDDADGLIDERGLAFVMEGNVLRVQLSIQGVDEDGHVRTRSAGTSIYVQNGD